MKKVALRIKKRLLKRSIIIIFYEMNLFKCKIIYFGNWIKKDMYLGICMHPDGKITVKRPAVIHLKIKRKLRCPYRCPVSNLPKRVKTLFQVKWINLSASLNISGTNKWICIYRSRNCQLQLTIILYYLIFAFVAENSAKYKTLFIVYQRELSYYYTILTLSYYYATVFGTRAWHWITRGQDKQNRHLKR